MSFHEPSMYDERMATPEGREGLRRAREWAERQRLIEDAARVFDVPPELVVTEANVSRYERCNHGGPHGTNMGGCVDLDPRFRPSTEDDPCCVHCGDTDLHWVEDPAPDLCAECASKGLWSPMWGENRADEYKALLKRLNEKRSDA